MLNLAEQFCFLALWETRSILLAELLRNGLLKRLPGKDFLSVMESLGGKCRVVDKHKDTCIDIALLNSISLSSLRSKWRLAKGLLPTCVRVCEPRCIW